MADALLPAGARVHVLSSGKAGHEINCLGVAEALESPYDVTVVRPRWIYSNLAPYGPVDGRDLAAWSARNSGGSGAQIIIACGRTTVPYVRAIKMAAPERVFAAFLQDPVAWRSTFDLIWAPEHDRLSAPNVLTTLTSPHPFGARRLKQERMTMDARLALLPTPRAAILLGGPSAGHEFPEADLDRLSADVAKIVAQGYSVMATPSRRTPPSLVQALRRGLGDGPAFVWDGSGENPYAQILAHADAILVTGDSVNMVGEAAATGAPIYLFEPSGGAKRTSRFLSALKQSGVARTFSGILAPYSYAAIDSSGTIAAEIVRRFSASPAARYSGAGF
jgi:mitochondrial fission protein ELM1